MIETDSRDDSLVGDLYYGEIDMSDFIALCSAETVVAMYSWLMRTGEIPRAVA